MFTTLLQSERTREREREREREFLHTQGYSGLLNIPSSSFKICHFCILIQEAEFLQDRKFALTNPPAQKPQRHPTLRPYLSARSYSIGSTPCLRTTFLASPAKNWPVLFYRPYCSYYSIWTPVSEYMCPHTTMCPHSTICVSMHKRV